MLLSSAYASEMTKPRVAAMRLRPPDSPLRQVTDRQRSYREGEPSLGQYELRAANTVAACETISPQPSRLLHMMEDHRFGRDELPVQYQAGSLKRALSELNLPDTWLSVSLRVTERTLGAALIFKGLDIREGWVVPRVTISPRDATGELLFTPSASRWADYYVSGGGRRQYVTTRETRTVETDHGPVDVEVIVPPNWKLVVEPAFAFAPSCQPGCGPLCSATASADCEPACRPWGSRASISSGSSGRLGREPGRRSRPCRSTADRFTG